MPVRTPVSRSLVALLVAAGAMTAACGNEQASHGSDAAAVQPSPPASATVVSPAESPTVVDPPAATAGLGRAEAARQEAERERRQAAPPGVTITPSPAGSGIPKGSEHFGTPVARRGDVIIYTPRRDKDALTVPVEVLNSGTKRAFYRFRIRVTGAGGFDATASTSMDVVGLYPGTSWPAELTVRDSGHTPPAQPHITIVSVERDEMAG